METQTQELNWVNVAEIDIIYRTKVKPSERPRIGGSKDIYSLLLSKWNMNCIELQEEFKVLYLNRANKVLGIYNASSGGITGTVADPRLILAVAVKCCASNLILSHNHPSGSLKPSQADEQLTLKIKEAARYLDIGVIDHVIISSEGYYSFADEGLL
jgi:DNA repair protein RadC